MWCLTRRGSTPRWKGRESDNMGLFIRFPVSSCDSCIAASHHSIRQRSARLGFGPGFGSYFRRHRGDTSWRLAFGPLDDQLQCHFSIPLTAILFAKVVEPFFGIKLLDDRAFLTCWIFSIASGAALYPMALGLSELDPYAAGWEFSWLFVLMFFLTVVLLVMKNRFSLVGIAAILAYNLRLLESTNLWDYLVDRSW